MFLASGELYRGAIKHQQLFSLLCLWEKHISMSCLVGSGLNNIVLAKAHLHILFKSLLS